MAKAPPAHIIQRLLRRDKFHQLQGTVPALNFVVQRIIRPSVELANLDGLLAVQIFRADMQYAGSAAAGVTGALQELRQCRTSVHCCRFQARPTVKSIWQTHWEVLLVVGLSALCLQEEAGLKTDLSEQSRSTTASENLRSRRLGLACLDATS